MRHLRRGRGEIAAAGHRWGQLAAEDWEIGEGETRAEVGHAVGELAEGRIRNSAAEERDVMGAAGTDLEEALLAMVGHCSHEGLVDAGLERCMGDAEGH